MIVDKFWKFFWIGSGGVTIVGIAVALSLFVFYTRQGDLLAAVGVSYESGRDPFEGKLLTAGLGGSQVLLNAGYLYQNALPFHFQSWTWEAIADWRSTEAKKDDSYGLKITFMKPGGSVGMNGPAIDIHGMQSISLSVHPDVNVGDLYLDLYDKNGNSLGMQSLAWYTQNASLTPDTWTDVTLPLANFRSLEGGVETLTSSISGFSINSKNPGMAYVDNVQLSKKESSHAVWIASPEPLAVPFNPLATSSPVSLPYIFAPTPDSLVRWYTYFGNFGPGPSGEIEIGPSEVAKTNGSMTVFRGGRFWKDYYTEAVLNWGQVSVFSLLSRFVSDGDFVSCAFSRYGETAQLYHMKGGTSNFISQTPPLSVKDFEPWKGVVVGMEVRGSRASCFINGAKVLSADIPSMEQGGTIGFETWDPNPAAAPHALTSLKALSLTGE